MRDINEYLESGILEAYVQGSLSQDEADEVERMAASNYEIRSAIDEIGEAIELYALSNAIEPASSVKPILMATIDYTERLQNGEAQSFPPDLCAGSKITDYDEWLTRPDMKAPEVIEGIYAKIIGYTPQLMTAIVWIKEMAPQEVHDDEYEKFLIVEGTCDIIIGDEKHQLVPGDVLTIPLHKNHLVKVTSPIPCKVILQRAAA